MSVMLASLPADSALLRDMLANAPTFGEPIHKSSFSSMPGTREVVLAPVSPARPPRPLSNGTTNGYGSPAAKRPRPDHPEAEERPNHAGPSRLPDLPTTPAQDVISSPSRKGKETARPTDEQILYTQPIDLSWPDRLAGAKKKGAGLYNPSQVCYANATLQVLLHTPPLLRMADSHSLDDCPKRQRNQWCMLCALQDLSVQHWGPRSVSHYMPKAVHDHLKDIKKGFSKHRQEDTHEFFRFVTDALQNTALFLQPKNLPAKVKHTTWVYQLWGGRVRSRVVCSRCNKPSDTCDDFLDLSLDVPRGSGRPSVLGMLQNYIKEDRLEGDNKYHCENCKSKANAKKSFRIDHAPPILTLHLKRFSVRYNSYNGKANANKFNDVIEYGEWLDIAPFMVDPKSPETKYRLFAVTCHRGAELRFGHYTSYVRSPSGQWFHADDEDMEPVSRNEHLRDKHAYLLSYIRTEGGGPSVSGTSTPAKTPIANGGHSNGHMANGRSSPIPTPLSKKRPIDEPQESPRKQQRITPPPRPSNPALPSPPPTMGMYGDQSPRREDFPSRFGGAMKKQPAKFTPKSQKDFYGNGHGAARRGNDNDSKRKDRMKTDDRRPKTPMPFQVGAMGGNGPRRHPGFTRMQGRR